MHLWIRVVTWSRILLACAVALAWTFGHFELGAWFFAAGLLTKAADTPLSVWRQCPILTDDWLYRLVAVMFNAAAVVGLAAGYAHMAMQDKMHWVAAALLVATTASLMAITRLYVKPHSLLAKARSGFISALVLFFAAPYAPIWLSFTSLGLIWLGEGYKLMYYSQTAETR